MHTQVLVFIFAMRRIGVFWYTMMDRVSEKGGCAAISLAVVLVSEA